MLGEREQPRWPKVDQILFEGGLIGNPAGGLTCDQRSDNRRRRFFRSRGRRISCLALLTAGKTFFMRWVTVFEGDLSPSVVEENEPAAGRAL